jgi:hypothetical protein
MNKNGSAIYTSLNDNVFPNSAGNVTFSEAPPLTSVVEFLI